MITHLKGRVEEIYDNSIDLDVQGVGYNVLCSSRFLGSLKIGDEIKVFTDLTIREDSWIFFGFKDLEEKRWFKLLTSVQGVGGRVGIAILSACSKDDLYNAFLSSDKKIFLKASGVGTKLAARIISELKERVVGKFEISNIETSANEVIEDVISALLNLGYSRVDIISEISKQHIDSSTKFDILLKQVLSKLSS